MDSARMRARLTTLLDDTRTAAIEYCTAQAAEWAAKREALLSSQQHGSVIEAEDAEQLLQWYRWQTLRWTARAQTWEDLKSPLDIADHIEKLKGKDYGL